MKSDYDKNPNILNNFLNYLSGVKGYSKNTIKAYNLDLINFFKFIKEYMDIKVEIKEFNSFILLQVKKADILAFLAYLNYAKDNSPYTRQRKLSAIRVFYKWLLVTIPEGGNTVNATYGIDNIQKVERLPKYLNLEQAKKIQTVFSIQNSQNPIRNNTVISVFLNTGMRVSELINIKFKDIDFKQNSISVVGKGNKERIVYFSNSCKQSLLKYINYRNRKEGIIDINDYLFVNNQHKKISIVSIENICKKAFKLMELDGLEYTPHTLRHTTATIMYKYVKEDILLLKSFLGHKSIISTQIYTHIDSKRLKEAVDKNPLNNIIKAA